MKHLLLLTISFCIFLLTICCNSKVENKPKETISTNKTDSTSKKVKIEIIHDTVWKEKKEYYIGVTPIKTNFLWLEIDNPVDITGNVDLNKIEIVVENATIQRIVDLNKYKTCWIKPKHPGYVTLKIYLKEDEKLNLLQNRRFGVLPFPTPVAHIAGTKYGKTPKNSLIEVGCIQSYLVNIGVDIHFEVLSYDVILIRNTQVLLNKTFKEQRFSKELIEEFKKVEVGDRLIVTNIKVKVFDEIWTAQSIDLVIN